MALHRNRCRISDQICSQLQGLPKRIELQEAQVIIAKLSGWI
jgi:hypothetical protein